MDNQEKRHRHRYWGGLGMGLVVIAVGVVFLLRNLGIDLPFLQFHNWWAIFILIAALGPLSYAAQRWHELGRVDGLVLHSLLSALVIVLVASFFLLDLSWERWWPLFVIYGGLWMLVKGVRRNGLL
jgi:FtsH-binding integral membrane protein